MIRYLITAPIVASALAPASLAQSGTDEPLPGHILRRDEAPLAIIRGSHPREEGMWIQYLGLDTGLRQNITVTDIIYPDSPWENYLGERMDPHDEKVVGATNFGNTHNHYQNVLSEVWNFKRAANAVSVWGDSAAWADGAKSWGAFFSSRSNPSAFVQDERMTPYWPEGLEPNDPENFDCQLIGVEIDVLNGGKPGNWPNMSKTALQLVGFGNPNSMAIEVRCQGSGSKDPANWQGQFMNGIYFLNSVHKDGRMLVADMSEARIGLDMDRPLFKQGAIRLRSEGVGTGILYNGGASGEIYGGLRWPDFEDKKNWLTLRAGEGGIRMASRDNTKEFIRVDNHGGIYLRGTVYVNGKMVDFEKLTAGQEEAQGAGLTPGGPTGGGLGWRDAMLATLGAGVLGLGMMVVRLQARLAALSGGTPSRGAPLATA